MWGGIKNKESKQNMHQRYKKREEREERQPEERQNIRIYNNEKGSQKGWQTYSFGSKASLLLLFLFF